MFELEPKSSATGLQKQHTALHVAPVRAGAQAGNTMRSPAQLQMMRHDRARRNRFATVGAPAHQQFDPFNYRDAASGDVDTAAEHFLSYGVRRPDQVDQEHDLLALLWRNAAADHCRRQLRGKRGLPVIGDETPLRSWFFCENAGDNQPLFARNDAELTLQTLQTLCEKDGQLAFVEQRVDSWQKLLEQTPATPATRHMLGQPCEDAELELIYQLRPAEELRNARAQNSRLRDNPGIAKAAAEAARLGSAFVRARTSYEDTAVKLRKVFNSDEVGGAFQPCLVAEDGHEFASVLPVLYRSTLLFYALPPTRARLTREVSALALNTFDARLDSALLNSFASFNWFYKAPDSFGDADAVGNEPRQPLAACLGHTGPSKDAWTVRWTSPRIGGYSSAHHVVDAEHNTVQLPRSARALALSQQDLGRHYSLRAQSDDPPTGISGSVVPVLRNGRYWIDDGKEYRQLDVVWTEGGTPVAPTQTDLLRAAVHQARCVLHKDNPPNWQSDANLNGSRLCVALQNMLSRMPSSEDVLRAEDLQTTALAAIVREQSAVDDTTQQALSEGLTVQQQTAFVAAALEALTQCSLPMFDGVSYQPLLQYTSDGQYVAPKSLVFSATDWQAQVRSYGRPRRQNKLRDVVFHPPPPTLSAPVNTSLATLAATALFAVPVGSSQADATRFAPESSVFLTESASFELLGGRQGAGALQRLRLLHEETASYGPHLFTLSAAFLLRRYGETQQQNHPLLLRSEQPADADLGTWGCDDDDCPSSVRVNVDDCTHHLRKTAPREVQCGLISADTHGLLSRAYAASFDTSDDQTFNWTWHLSLAALISLKPQRENRGFDLASAAKAPQPRDGT